MKTWFFCADEKGGYDVMQAVAVSGLGQLAEDYFQRNRAHRLANLVVVLNAQELVYGAFSGLF